MAGVAEGGPHTGRVRLVTVDEGGEGQRLDNFLISELKGVPRSWIYRVLRRGEVRVNRGRSKPARRLRAGDEVRFPPLRQAECQPTAPPQGLRKKIENAI